MGVGYRPETTARLIAAERVKGVCCIEPSHAIWTANPAGRIVSRSMPTGKSGTRRWRWGGWSRAWRKSSCQDHSRSLNATDPLGAVRGRQQAKDRAPEYDPGVPDFTLQVFAPTSWRRSALLGRARQRRRSPRPRRLADRDGSIGRGCGVSPEQVVAAFQVTVQARRKGDERRTTGQDSAPKLNEWPSCPNAGPSAPVAAAQG